jgi:hypothetical protein
MRCMFLKVFGLMFNEACFYRCIKSCRRGRDYNRKDFINFFNSVYSVWRQTPFFYYQLNAQYLLHTNIWCVSAPCFGDCAPSSGETAMPFPLKTNYCKDTVICGLITAAIWNLGGGGIENKKTTEFLGLSRYSDWLLVRRSGDRIPVAGAIFSTPVHTGAGAHLASYTMGTGYFPGLRAAGAWRWPLTPI